MSAEEVLNKWIPDHDPQLPYIFRVSILAAMEEYAAMRANEHKPGTDQIQPDEPPAPLPTGLS